MTTEHFKRHSLYRIKTKQKETIHSLKIEYIIYRPLRTPSPIYIYLQAEPRPSGLHYTPLTIESHAISIK